MGYGDWLKDPAIASLQERIAALEAHGRTLVEANERHFKSVLEWQQKCAALEADLADERAEAEKLRLELGEWRNLRAENARLREALELAEPFVYPGITRGPASAAWCVAYGKVCEALGLELPEQFGPWVRAALQPPACSNCEGVDPGSCAIHKPPAQEEKAPVMRSEGWVQEGPAWFKQEEE